MNPPAFNPEPKWLDWSKRLQAIAQTGLTFASDPYDVERYIAIRDIAAEILSLASQTELPVVRDLLGKDTGYATPKVDVRGVVFREGKLLFVREAAEGRWSLPGGWADVCQSVGENVVREIREESGFEARPVKILAVFDRSKHPHEQVFIHHVYKVFVLCEITGGAASAVGETDGVGFFGEGELPELSVSRMTASQIERLFEHHRNPETPTDFD